MFWQWAHLETSRSSSKNTAISVVPASGFHESIHWPTSPLLDVCSTTRFVPCGHLAAWATLTTSAWCEPFTGLSTMMLMSMRAPPYSALSNDFRRRCSGFCGVLGNRN